MAVQSELGVENCLFNCYILLLVVAGACMDTSDVDKPQRTGGDSGRRSNQPSRASSEDLQRGANGVGASSDDGSQGTDRASRRGMCAVLAPIGHRLWAVVEPVFSCFYVVKCRWHTRGATKASLMRSHDNVVSFHGF